MLECEGEYESNWLGISWSSYNIHRICCEASFSKYKSITHHIYAFDWVWHICACTVYLIDQYMYILLYICCYIFSLHSSLHNDTTHQCTHCHFLCKSVSSVTTASNVYPNIKTMYNLSYLIWIYVIRYIGLSQHTFTYIQIIPKHAYKPSVGRLLRIRKHFHTLLLLFFFHIIIPFSYIRYPVYWWFVILIYFIFLKL